jgi:hypothetical protein
MPRRWSAGVNGGPAGLCAPVPSDAVIEADALSLVRLCEPPHDALRGPRRLLDDLLEHRLIETAPLSPVAIVPLAIAHAVSGPRIIGDARRHGDAQRNDAPHAAQQSQIHDPSCARFPSQHSWHQKVVATERSD